MATTNNGLMGSGSDEVLCDIVHIARADVARRQRIQEESDEADEPLSNQNVNALCAWADALVKIDRVRRQSNKPEDLTEDELITKIKQLQADPNTARMLKGAIK